MKKHRGNWKEYGVDWLFLAPYLILFVLFSMVPVVISLFLGFTNYNVLEAPKWVGVNNYLKLFLEDSLFFTVLKNTIILSAITGPVSFFLSLTLAWLLNEFGPRIRTLFTIVFYAPALSGSIALIWQLIFSGDSHGYLNAILMSLNIIYEPIQWLTDATYMFPAAIIALLWMSLGTSFLSFIAGFQNMDRTLYEAAAVDGIKNRWQELWYITLPTMKSQLMFGAVMSISGSFGIGDTITGLFGFPSTNYVLHTMVHHLQDYGSIRMEMGYASAIATLLFLIMIGSNKLVQKLLSKVGQ